MKAWFKTHAALQRMEKNPDVAFRMAQNLHADNSHIYPFPEDQVAAWRWYLEAMEDAHVFEFDDDIALLMTLTDNEPHEIKLPFPLVWLDVEFEFQTKTGLEHFQGILLRDAPLIFSTRKAWRLLPGTEKRIEYDAEKHDKDDYTEHAIPGMTGAIGFLRVRGNMVVELVQPIGDDPRQAFKNATGRELHMTRLGQKEHKLLSNLITNFLDLLETPDVMLVPLKRRHIGRHQTGKMPVSEKVVVRASIRRYIDQLKASGQFHYSHRFWVRGHWRHYRNDRYKNKQGEKEWIKPFIKGEGILVKKQYVLPSDKREPEEL